MKKKKNLVEKYFSSTVSSSENFVEDWIISYQQDEKYPGFKNRIQESSNVESSEPNPDDSQQT